LNRGSREEGEKLLDEELLTRLNIRPLAIGDLEAMVEIDRKVLGKPRLDFWKKRVEVITTEYPHSGLVAELEGKVIGFVVGEVSDWEFGIPDKIGWLSTIGVDPAFGELERLGPPQIFSSHGFHKGRGYDQSGTENRIRHGYG